MGARLLDLNQNSLIAAAIFIVVISIILSVGAIAICNMKANNSTGQEAIDNSCKSILNLAKFLPIVSDLVGS